jgi:dihydropteroate synthase
VASAALAAGASIVNDVSAGRDDPDLLAVAAEAKAPVVLMHMQGTPATMQDDPRYGDVVAEVEAFLAERCQAAEAAGVAHQALVIDPGIGFGKRDRHNLVLLARQDELLVLGLPLLAGWSRKGTLGRITGRPPGERTVASVAAALAAVQRGARIVRVHDVAETVDALKVWHAAALP